MLNRLLRAAHVERLIPHIEVIGPGPLFETFGTLLLARLHNIPLIQRGVTVRGNPSGGTLDATALNEGVAAEFSVQQGYFDTNKPVSDLAHALVMHPSATEIYLVSSQAARPGKADAFVEKHRPPCKNLHIYDARRIAEGLVDRLLSSDEAIDELAEYLPVLDTLRDEYALDLRAPRPGDGHISRPSVDQAISEALSQTPCLAITGMGGAGKSVAAAAFVEKHRAKYVQTIWLDGDSIHRPEDLSSVAIRRSGDAVNVVGLLKSRACLLVIDDANPNLKASDLLSLCGPGSHIVLTGRGPTAGYELPLLTIEEGGALLNAGGGAPCPADIFETIWKTTGGHPLSLALINTNIRNGATWEDAALDCSEIGILPDNDTRLSERVLGRLRPLFERELSVFAWASQPACDTDFLRSLILPSGVRHMTSNALTALATVSTTKLHDIVFAAMGGGAWCSNGRSAELDDLLERYITSLARGDTHQLQTVSSMHRSKLEAKVAAGDARPAYLYALIFAWDAAEADVRVLPDPLQLAHELRTATGAKRDMQLMLAIETIEALYRYEREMFGSDAAKAEYRERLAVFDVLDETPDLSPRQRAEIVHHRGKVHRSIGDGAEAARLFEDVLLSEVPLSEAKLQLVRLYAKAPNLNVERAEALARELVASIVGGGEGISSSVTLGLIEALHWAGAGWADRLLVENHELLMAHVSRGLLGSVPQAYETMASIVRHWAWAKPENLELIAAELAIPSLHDIREERGRGAFAEMHMSLAKIGFGDQADVHRRAALQAFEALKHPSAYQQRNHAELLIDLKRLPEADEILASITDTESLPFVAFSRSKANFGLGKTQEALAFANEAIAGGTGKNARYMWSFLLHRYEVRQAAGDPGAVADLDEAISVANARQREMLEKKRPR